MVNHPPTREDMLRYLLNEIEEDERERVDTLLIADEDYHAAFQELEYDLLDALDAGELTPVEAERARRALRPNDRWPMQRFGRNPRPDSRSGPVLVPSHVMPRTAVTPLTTSRWPRSWPVWVAAAALVLVTLGVGTRIFWLHRSDPPPQAHVDAPIVIPGPPASPKPELSPRVVDPPPLPKTAPLAMLLLPRASRSPHTLHLPIPHDALVVRIDWPPASTDGKESLYQLQVLTDTGKVSCTTRGTVLRGSGPAVIRFLCPARDVPSGVDFIRVTSLPADPEVPSLLEVTVSVERKPASAG